MKITEICESTTAGSVATVAAPMNGRPLKRSAVGKGVYGKEPAGSLLTGKKTSKPFANSVKEGAGENSKSQTPLFGRDFKECHRCFGLGKQRDGYRCHVCNGTGMVDLKTPHNGGSNNQTNEEGGFQGEPGLVLYIDGKPTIKYADLSREKKYSGSEKKYFDINKAEEDLAILKGKYPTKTFELKSEVIKESGMPAPVIKHKQKLAGMSDAELAEHLKDKSDDELKKMAERHGYGKSSLHYVNRVNKGKKINEGELQETDLIIVPGQGHRLKSGFISHAEDRRDHEVEMARSDLHQAHKNSSKIHRLIKNVSEDDGLEGWVQAKITKAADYLNSVCQYLEGKQLQEMTGGVIAGGGVGEAAGSYGNATVSHRFANRFGYDSDYQATKHKPNKHGYIAPHVDTRDDSNIMVQLQKNINSNRASPLEFKDGSTLEIGPSAAIAALNRIASMKAAEKHETVKNLALSKNNFISFLNDVDQLDEGMGLKQLAAAAAAIGYMLVPSNVGDGTSGRSSADRAYDTYLSQTPSHLIPRYTAPTKAK